MKMDIPKVLYSRLVVTPQDLGIFSLVIVCMRSMPRLTVNGVRIFNMSLCMRKYVALICPNNPCANPELLQASPQFWVTATVTSRRTISSCDPPDARWASLFVCLPAPRQTVLVRPKNCGVNDSFRDLLLDVSPELLDRLLRDP